MAGAPRDEEIIRLVKRGLVQFERGDVDAAMELWRGALDLDPNNRAAKDYLASAAEQRRRSLRRLGRADGPSASPADTEDTPRTLDGVMPELGPASPDAAGPDMEVQEALRAYRAGDLDRAHEILERVAQRDPDRIDVEGYLAMLRSKRTKLWVKTIGDQGRILRLSISADKLRALRLAPDEGFILSQIDGQLSVDDLLSLHTDRVRVLEVLARFVSDGIVS